MTEITFFATDDDCDAIWGVILEELRMTAFPDPWFGELPAPGLTTRTDVRSNLEQYPRVAPGLGYFLTSPDWSREPLEYRLCEDNQNFKPFWSVSQRYGGPSIHFIPRFGYPRSQEAHQLRVGMFGDYPYYYSVSDHRQIMERPAGLVSTMKAIRRGLRSDSTIVQDPTGQRAIAMRNALAAHETGTALGAGNVVYSPMKTGRRTSR